MAQPRKVVQIMELQCVLAAVRTAMRVTTSTASHTMIVALCDDGTLWSSIVNGADLIHALEWTQLAVPPIG